MSPNQDKDDQSPQLGRLPDAQTQLAVFIGGSSTLSVPVNVLGKENISLEEKATTVTNSLKAFERIEEKKMKTPHDLDEVRDSLRIPLFVEISEFTKDQFVTDDLENPDNIAMWDYGVSCIRLLGHSAISHEGKISREVERALLHNLLLSDMRPPGF